MCIRDRDASPQIEGGITMSSEQVAVVRRAYEGFAKGDIPSVLGLIAPQDEWVETDLEAIPTHGTHRGLETGARSVFAPVPQYFSAFAIVPEQFLEVGDHVVVTGRVRATGKETGRSMNAPFAHVFTVRDGKITKLLNFHDTRRWLHVLGGQP